MPAPADQTDTTPSRSTRLLAAVVLLMAALAGLSIAQTRAPLAAIPAPAPIPAPRQPRRRPECEAEIACPAEA